MKLVSFERGGTLVAGVLFDSVILDVGRLAEVLDVEEAFSDDVKGLLSSGRLEELKRHFDAISSISDDDDLLQVLRRADIAVDADAARLGAPIPKPGLIVSSGGAYRDHLEEMDVGSHEDPMGFIKNSAAVCASGDDILLPKSAPDMVDWEGEFACVIGKTCHAISPEEVENYLAGYTLINDVSARDGLVEFLTPSGDAPLEVFNRGSLMVLGKQYPTFCPMGPCLVTTDELADPGNVDLWTKVNGKVMQSANTQNLIHDLATTVSYFSRFYRFEPGDIISTGTPAGVGVGRKPPLFLRAGDVVEVGSPQIGILRNVVSGP